MNRRKVLVIDDDAAIRTLFDALLTRHNCQVEHAGDGADGLSKLGNGDDYEVIILDLMMPNLGGLQLLDDLRRANPSLLKKIIVATGASRAYVEKIDPSTVHAVIRKPFDIAQLINAVLTCGRTVDA